MRYNPRVSTMKKILFLILTLLFTTTLSAENLVLVNGTIIDGTLKARFNGNVRIRDGKITDIGTFRPAAGEMTLDVKGLIVAPGFVDLQNHSTAETDTSQGITTALLGSDGKGPYAVEQFMAPFDEKTPALNIVALVGHATVRRQIMGNDYDRAATPDEIGRMGELVEGAMREGAFGIASDLRSEPASYSATDELLALARATARYGGFFSIRLRDETDKVMESVAEAIEIGRATKVRVQISEVRSSAAAVLAAIDKARAAGVDVSADTSVTDDSPDLRAFLQHPWVMIARTFPRVLGFYVREQKVIPLERAIRKMTGLPALRLGFEERGMLVKGGAADIVIFDPVHIAETAGIKYVFVNGVMVVKDGQSTGERPGVALR